MSIWKRILLLLAVFLLMLSAVSFPVRERIPSWIATLRNSWDDRPYQQVACGSDGLICAARIQEDDTLMLRFFSPGDKDSKKDKDSKTHWSVTLPEAAAAGDLCMLFPSGNQCAYFGIYEEDAHYLALYRVKEDEGPECLLREECPGNSIVERRANLSFSSVTQQQEKVYFTVLTEDTALLLSYSPVDGLKTEKEAERNGALSAVGVSQTLYRGEGTETLLTFAGNGLYYLDGSTLTMHYADLSAETHDIDLLNLDEYIGDYQLTSISLTSSGSALLLLDGHTLNLVQGNGVQDLTDQLFPDRTDCMLILGLLLAAALIPSILIWWGMVGLFRSRLPLSVYWGVVSLSLFMVGGFLFYVFLMVPAEQNASLGKKTDITDSVVGMILAEHTIQDENLSSLLCRSLESLDEDIDNLQVVQLYRDGANWYHKNKVRGELNSAVQSAILNEALDTGKEADRIGGKYWYAMTQGGNGIMISFRWTEDTGFTNGQKTAILGLGTMAAVVVFILFLIGYDVKRTANGLERYAGDLEWHKVRVSGGDELEGMAATLNSLAAERREAERQRERIVNSYRRFVPEEILQLLGKRSVLDVDKKTLVSRQMAVLKVSFTFPDPVYTNSANTRLLFDSVNQVIERTATIVRQKGGAVFNYAYSGYDIVMELDPKQVVSTAVAVRQEVLSLNEQRAQDALPTVTLHIAVDVGEVIMGIVGDEAQIEPSTISDSFSTLQELISICDRVEANILCTESVISGVAGYSSRYMGKCSVGRKAVRVYEVFDGDPYDVRKGKEAGVHRFSEGVLSLYSGEIVQAKRVFLDLVRDAPQDGGARYYLYLADRLTEEDTFNGLYLNGRMEIDDDKI